MEAFLSTLPRSVPVGVMNVIIATIVQTVGMATSHWYIIKDFHMGIFERCDRHKYEEICLSDNLGLLAIMLLEMTSMLCGIGATVLIFAFLGFYQKEGLVRSKVLPILTFVLCLASAICSLGGCIDFVVILPFPSEAFKYLGYSFYLCVVAGVLFFPAANLLLVGSMAMVESSMRGERDMEYVMSDMMTQGQQGHAPMPPPNLPNPAMSHEWPPTYQLAYVQSPTELTRDDSHTY